MYTDTLDCSLVIKYKILCVLLLWRCWLLYYCRTHLCGHLHSRWLRNLEKEHSQCLEATLNHFLSGGTCSAGSRVSLSVKENISTLMVVPWCCKQLIMGLSRSYLLICRFNASFWCVFVWWTIQQTQRLCALFCGVNMTVLYSLAATDSTKLKTHDDWILEMKWKLLTIEVGGGLQGIYEIDIWSFYFLFKSF